MRSASANRPSTATSRRAKAASIAASNKVGFDVAAKLTRVRCGLVVGIPRHVDVLSSEGISAVVDDDTSEVGPADPRSRSRQSGAASVGDRNREGFGLVVERDPRPRPLKHETPRRDLPDMRPASDG